MSGLGRERAAVTPTPAELAAVVLTALRVGPLPAGTYEREQLDAGHDALDALLAAYEEMRRELQELADMASPGIISERARRVLARTAEKAAS